jgi:CHAD domain-containing protein
MAKARRIDGLSADQPYELAAAQVVEVRSAELIDHANGVLDLGDIERLHDMRVATRRLRATLEIFEPCFSRKEWKATLRGVKALADALGERRDRDVAIAALEEVRQAMPAPDRPGVNTLIESLRLEQAAANKSLAAFVSKERLSSLHEQLAELVANARPLPGEDHGRRGEVVELPNRSGERVENGSGGESV